MELGVQDQKHRGHRRGRSNRMGPHGGASKLAQGIGLMVPLHEIPNHSRHVDGVMGRHRAMVIETRNHVDRHPVGVSVINRHGRVLQADGAMEQGHHRFAFDLGVAVRHGDRGLFVEAGEELRHPVVAVVDDGFLQSFEASSPDSKRSYSMSRALSTSTM